MHGEDESPGWVLRQHGLRAKKQFGQNFMTDKKYLNVLVDSLDITEDDKVIEVGPGLGDLTKILAEKAGHVLAVEIDEDLIPVLKSTLREYDNIKLLSGDILKLDIPSVLGSINSNHEDKSGRGGWKLASNLPYYAATSIITRFLEHNPLMDKMSVMLQKEVAERIVAEPGTKAYGSLSVYVKYFAKAKIISKVPSGAFYPAPDVESAIVCFDIYEKPCEGFSEKVENEKIFFAIIKGAFATRRKTLINSLRAYSGLEIDDGLLKKALKEVDIDPMRRGETLDIFEFARISNVLAKMLKK